MLLLSHEDVFHEELQHLAERVGFRFEDLFRIPSWDGVFQLPVRSWPATTSELCKSFYLRHRDTIYHLAKTKGLFVGKKSFLGPHVGFLRRGSKVLVKEDHISFLIILPQPHEAQAADEASGEKGSKAKKVLPSSTAGNAVAEALATEQDEWVRVKIVSPAANSSRVQSQLTLKAGDVIILQGNEEIHVLESHRRNGVAGTQGICMVTIIHLACPGEVGQGGWIQETVETVDRGEK